MSLQSYNNILNYLEACAPPLAYSTGPPGYPSFIGMQPAVQFDDLQLVKADTRRAALGNTWEGFSVMCRVFPGWRPTVLRDHVLAHSRGACLEAAIARFAADKDPRLIHMSESALLQLETLIGSQSPLLTIAPEAMRYLHDLAVASALDQAAVALPLSQAVVVGGEEHAPPKACLLCGEVVAAGGSPCGACSRGHAVCSGCLRQYVLHTHGLKAGIERLRCFAFDEPPVGVRLPHRRCSGLYAADALVAALKPTELLALQVSDLQVAERQTNNNTIPFTCVTCGHSGRIGHYTVKYAAARPRVVRSFGMLRVLGVPLIPGRPQRFLPPAIRCPNLDCKTAYCCKCGSVHHKSGVCSTDPQDAELLEWVQGRKKQVQGCPKCGMAIEKRGGCKYMLCPRNGGGCGYEFCWTCRASYLGLHKCGKQAQDYD